MTSGLFSILPDWPVRLFVIVLPRLMLAADELAFRSGRRQQVDRPELSRTVANTFEATVPFLDSVDETLDVGEHRGTPMLEDFARGKPFRFNGMIDEVTIELK